MTDLFDPRQILAPRNFFIFLLWSLPNTNNGSVFLLFCYSLWSKSVRLILGKFFSFNMNYFTIYFTVFPTWQFSDFLDGVTISFQVGRFKIPENNQNCLFICYNIKLQKFFIGFFQAVTVIHNNFDNLSNTWLIRICLHSSKSYD